MFYKNEEKIYQSISIPGYEILISQEDINRLYDTMSDEKDVKIIPVAFKGTCPYKRINGNVAKRMNLKNLPKDYISLVKNMLKEKLSTKKV
jgi:hypothetical protein